MPPEIRKKLLNHLHRIEGQLHGIIRMLESEAPCESILMQIAAIKSSLARISQQLLADHIQHCLVEVFQKGDEEAQSRKIADLIRIFSLYIGSKR